MKIISISSATPIATIVFLSERKQGNGLNGDKARYKTGELSFILPEIVDEGLQKTDQAPMMGLKTASKLIKSLRKLFSILNC